MSDLSLIHLLTGFLPIIVLMIGMQILKKDSFPDSRLFIIDQARTLRFAVGYFIFLELTILSIGVTGLFLLVGLTILLGLIVWIILNLFVGIIILVNSLRGVDGIALVSLNSFIDFLGISQIDNSVESAFFNSWLVIVTLAFVIVTPVYTGKQMGKYLEDFKAVKILALIVSLLEASIILYFYSVGYMSAIEDILSAYSFSFIFGFILIRFLILIQFASSHYQAKKEEKFYELVAIVKLRRAIMFMFGVFGIVALGLLMAEPLFNDTAIIRDINSENAVFARLMTFSFFLIQSIFVFPILFFSRGDYPLSFKIDELELREDLRKDAEEFRNLDKDNIEEFARKNASRL